MGAPVIYFQKNQVSPANVRDLSENMLKFLQKRGTISLFSIRSTVDAFYLRQQGVVLYRLVIGSPLNETRYRMGTTGALLEDAVAIAEGKMPYLTLRHGGTVTFSSPIRFEHEDSRLATMTEDGISKETLAEVIQELLRKAEAYSLFPGR